ncbi:hypothetical protein BDV12DRAFT_196843 [Aspergillus spectabilis]
MFLNDTWVKICLFPNQFSIRWVWFGPALKAFGGGANFGASMFFTAATDVIEEKERVDVFMKLFAMEMVVQIAGVPLVSALMTISSWYPLGHSSVLLVVAGHNGLHASRVASTMSKCRLWVAKSSVRARLELRPG